MPARPAGGSCRRRPERRGGQGPGARRAFSAAGGVAYCGVAHVRRPSHFERERIMAKQFFGGSFATLTFVVVVLAALFGIFTLVSYIAGPVGR